MILLTIEWESKRNFSAFPCLPKSNDTARMRSASGNPLALGLPLSSTDRVNLWLDAASKIRDVQKHRPVKKQLQPLTHRVPNYE
jgi:hypothetical protein